MYYVTTATDPVQTAVSMTDLAAYLTLPANDPVLPLVAADATAQVIEYLECDLIERGRIVEFPEWPVIGTPTNGLYRATYMLAQSLPLPYANLLEVESVTAEGEVITDYKIEPGKPAQLHMSHRARDIVIEYKAGFGGSITDVPQAIRLQIMKLAAYLYEHRGACDAEQALKDSGAKRALIPYKFGVVVI